MQSYHLTRRDALQTLGRSAAVWLTGSVSASSLGLAASAQIPEKIVLGTIPITPVIASYIGHVDFFKDEGLTIALTRFNNFAPIMQAMTAGSVVAGDFGVAPSIIGLTRGLPLITPFLSAFSTPSLRGSEREEAGVPRSRHGSRHVSRRPSQQDADPQGGH